MRLPAFPAYTLVELLIALTLSLLLLLGVAELFQRVGGSLNEARSSIRATTQLNEAAMLLRQDLSLIPESLATKPKDIIADGSVEPPGDEDGYLEIIEGPDTILEHPYVNERGDPDPTVGDVDDIIGFTVTNRAVPFRGVIRDEIVDRDSAEIVWFVRGNTLYRRVRLIDDVTQKGNTNRLDPVETFAELHSTYPNPESGQFVTVSKDETGDGGGQRYDAVLYKNDDGEDEWRWVTLLTLEDLARRARRFGHDGIFPNNFPHPLYDTPNEDWRYLRMPLIEESDHWSGEGIQDWKDDSAKLISSWKNSNSHLNDSPTDLWEQPYFCPGLLRKNNGSIIDADKNPHRERAGEDVVLTNVLSFDVKVWCPDKKEFVDLGEEGTTWAGEGNQPGLNHPPRLRTWDSWTTEYKDEADPLPPYTEPLEAIQITIRCFDPTSRIIKQVTVVHRFKQQ